MIGKALQILGVLFVLLVVYSLTVGKRRVISEYERGYIHGAARTMKVTGEAIQDARHRGVI